MGIDKRTTRLTYVECVLVGFGVAFSWFVVIVTLPITLPLTGLGYLALREDRDA